MDQAHRHSLQSKHSGLEARIHEEHLKPHPDDIELMRLKKEKLRIKEALERPA